MIQEEVSKRCDALEYEGSRIYDEEPDRLMFQMEVDRLCDKLKEEYSTTWLRSMISILLSDEIYKRRCKRRKMSFLVLGEIKSHEKPIIKPCSIRNSISMLPDIFQYCDK